MTKGEHAAWLKEGLKLLRKDIKLAKDHAATRYPFLRQKRVYGFQSIWTEEWDGNMRKKSIDE